MDEPLTSVFLAVIAVTALLQAAFVGGLAFALRAGTGKLDELQKAIDETVVPLAARAAEAAAKVEDATLRVHEQAFRTQRVLSDVVERVEGVLAGAHDRLTGLGARMDRVAHEMEDDRREQLEPLQERVGQVAALARGVRRAIEVWRGNGRV